MGNTRASCTSRSTLYQFSRSCPAATPVLMIDNKVDTLSVSWGSPEIASTPELAAARSRTRDLRPDRMREQSLTIQRPVLGSSLN
jgi:hypothetical protein